MTERNPAGQHFSIVKTSTVRSVRVGMNAGDSYRQIAAELRAKAAKEPRETLAAEWEHLARAYLRLAEQADTNSLQDVWLEIGGDQTRRGA